MRVGLLVEEKIRVCGSGKHPEVIILHGEQLRVTGVLDIWKDVGCWWLGEKEKTFYRLTVERGGILEIYRSSGDTSWILYRVYD